jgi:RAQPRD family integrative conjugative element protein
MIGIKRVLMGFWLLSITTANIALADSEGEKKALAQIIHELDAITPLIEEAQAQADQDRRIQFQYDWLVLDINRIKSAMYEHIAAPRTQPRSFPPLKGDYRN